MGYMPGIEKIDHTLPHYDVRVALASLEPGVDGDATVARLLRLSQGAYTTDLNAVVAALQASGNWWHLSHIEAVVTPTAPAEGFAGLMSNAARYDREGRPVEYRCIFAHPDPALALCVAWVMARYDLPAAYFVVASAYEEATAKKPESTEYMMAYYQAIEEQRSEAIRQWEAANPTAS